MAKASTGFEVRNRPDWLYNSLPYSYIAIGLIVMADFGWPNVLGIFSGVMFVCTGVIVFTMRRLHRKELAKLRAELHEGQGKESVDDDFVLLQLSWSKGYESGNAIIDEQHRRLFDMGNALLNAMLSHKPSTEISLSLDALLEHVQQHFRTEEKILADLKHPLTIEHKATHEQLLARLREMVNKYCSRKLDFGELSEFITFDLIAKHIATEDRKYFGSYLESPTRSSPFEGGVSRPR